MVLTKNKFLYFYHTLLLPDKYRAALYTGIKDAILSHGGQIEMKFIFQMYMGRKE